jgi:hypothetical protein
VNCIGDASESTSILAPDGPCEPEISLRSQTAKVRETGRARADSELSSMDYREVGPSQMTPAWVGVAIGVLAGEAEAKDDTVALISVCVCLLPAGIGVIGPRAPTCRRPRQQAPRSASGVIGDPFPRWQRHRCPIGHGANVQVVQQREAVADGTANSKNGAMSGSATCSISASQDGVQSLRNGDRECCRERLKRRRRRTSVPSAAT